MTAHNVLQFCQKIRSIVIISSSVHTPYLLPCTERNSLPLRRKIIQTTLLKQNISQKVKMLQIKMKSIQQFWLSNIIGT